MTIWLALQAMDSNIPSSTRPSITDPPVRIQIRFQILEHVWKILSDQNSSGLRSAHVSTHYYLAIVKCKTYKIIQKSWE